MNARRHPVYYSVLGLITGISIAIGSYALADVETPVMARTSQQALPLEDVQRFTNAIRQIKSFYVEPVSDSVLFENAIRGMLAGLDPHSAYLDEAEFKQLTSATNGEFAGLGIEVTMEDGLIRVITPIDDTPAWHAGIKAGDLIVRLDKSPIKGMSLKNAIEKMRGKKGSIVNLTVIREGEKKPLSFNIVRDVIHVKSTKHKVLDGNYGYVRLSHFQLSSADNLANAIKLINSQTGGKMKGLILDLRNNPGGLLDSAIEVSDLFLDRNKMGVNKLIVYTEGRVPGAHFAANARPGDVLNGTPIVILINEGSASAAEIVAGALQDHKRAVLVGKDTFGKGSVQTVLPLDNNTGVKITTALYFTPLGRSIQAKGIKPDIVVDDLKLQQQEEPLVESLKETNLAGHLENIDGVDNNTATEGKADRRSLANEDYPLYEALNVLKGMVVVQRLR
jgi:carboxyl-terminal processing protease